MKKQFAIVVIIAGRVLHAQDLTSAEAATHVGQTATVCGTVSGMHATLRAKGQPAFLDLDGRYPQNLFTVLIWGKDQPKFGNLARFSNQHICVHGSISSYRGKPEMILHDPIAILSLP
jgi:endonuclease G